MYTGKFIEGNHYIDVLNETFLYMGKYNESSHYILFSEDEALPTLISDKSLREGTMSELVHSKTINNNESQQLLDDKEELVSTLTFIIKNAPRLSMLDVIKLIEETLEKIKK